MAGLFSESKTKQNLMRAFAGEGQARNRYTFAAEQARKEGKPAIADIFLYTADQERAHAGRYYELLKEASGTNIFIDGSYPVDETKTLVQLLRASAHNEQEEAVTSTKEKKHLHCVRYVNTHRDIFFLVFLICTLDFRQ